jgi:hypothetical protein
MKRIELVSHRDRVYAYDGETWFEPIVVIELEIALKETGGGFVFVDDTETRATSKFQIEPIEDKLLIDNLGLAYYGMSR